MRFPLAAATLFAVVPIVAAFQQTTSNTFVIRDEDGGDTVAVEQLSRTPSTITGDVSLPQQQAHVHYVLHVGADGVTQRAEVLNDARNFFTGTIVFEGPAGGPSPMPGPVPATRIVQGRAGAHPVIGISIALFDQLSRTTHPALGDSAMVPVMNIRNRYEGTASIKRISADSVRIYCQGCMNRGAIEELRFAIARDGSILGGTSPSQHWTIARR